MTAGAASKKPPASAPPAGPAAPKVFLLCSGLGHIRRGFESFTEECFDALVSEPAVDLTLFAGAGASGPDRIALPILRRNRALTRWLGAVTGRGVLFIEQVTFFLTLIPYLLSRRPDVVFFSEGPLGNMLWHWRRITGASYRLLFSNGGPFDPPFERWDRIQQVNPLTLRQALAAGETAQRNTLLPYGFDVDPEFAPTPPNVRDALRRELELPAQRPVLLSVGAINVSHKRMDYLVGEVARLAAPRPFLVMLGQRDEESAAIEEQALAQLGAGNFTIRTVSSETVQDFYRVSDVFVLTSLSEAFGRVFAEAMAHGLPCIAHDYEVARYVLGGEGCYCDMNNEGALAQVLAPLCLDPGTPADARRRHGAVYEKFSWETLRPRYIGMIRDCAALSCS